MTTKKPALKPTKKPRTRYGLTECWTLLDDGGQVAQVVRSHGTFNVYLRGSDEPVWKTFTCWEDAKDYVFRVLKISR